MKAYPYLSEQKPAMRAPRNKPIKDNEVAIEQSLKKIVEFTIFLQKIFKFFEKEL